jgi:hypothetical protein
VAYALLALVYLLYLPHAQFVLDDWFVLGRYEQAREAGELGRTAAAIVQNQFHGQFRFQWLSFLLGYGLWLAAGYSPKVVFLASLALHTGCAAALRAALGRLRVGKGEAFLAGALFLLLPTTHGALLWSFNCAFFLWSTLWFLLFLREYAGDGPLWRQITFLLLALFSGDPVFALLLVAPLVAWRGWRRAASVWGTVATAAALYALVVNKAPVFRAGLDVRYQFTGHRALAMLGIIENAYRKMTGLTPDSYYRLDGWWWAAGAAGVVAWGIRATRTQETRWKTLGLAAVLWGAAYGPILFLRAHEPRYDYVPSPYLALGLSAAAMAWPRGRVALGAVLSGWLAMATAGNIQQSWIPQARRLRAIEEKLRSIQVAKGDTIVVSGTVMWIGTAPHFAFLAGWASTPFAEYVTGVRGIEAACDIVEEGDVLRLRHRNYQRDWKPEEAARTRVFVVRKEGRLEERNLLARAVRSGRYQLYALKGYGGPPVPAEPVGRDQLAFLEREIYFVQRGH